MYANPATSLKQDREGLKISLLVSRDLFVALLRALLRQTPVQATLIALAAVASYAISGSITAYIVKGPASSSPPAAIAAQPRPESLAQPPPPTEPHTWFQPLPCGVAVDCPEPPNTGSGNSRHQPPPAGPRQLPRIVVAAIAQPTSEAPANTTIAAPSSPPTNVTPNNQPAGSPATSPAPGQGTNQARPPGNHPPRHTKHPSAPDHPDTLKHRRPSWVHSANHPRVKIRVNRSG
jgi:hypothetical protein